MVTLENIVNERNLLLACGQVMGNDGAPGVDGMRAEDLFTYLVQHWQDLQKAVLEGSCPSHFDESVVHPDRELATAV